MTAQLRAVFDKMSSALILELYLADTPLSEELKNYAEELAGLTEKIQLETIRLSDTDSAPVKTEDLPCVRVCRKDGEWSGLAFHGVPGGHEFTSFVLGLLRLFLDFTTRRDPASRWMRKRCQTCGKHQEQSI